MKFKSPEPRADKDMSEAIDRKEGTMSVFSEGDTAEYIKNLLKGSGASINFDQLRDELNSKGEGTSFAQTISSHASVDHHTQNENSISNLDSFNEFLKVIDPFLVVLNHCLFRASSKIQIFHKFLREHFIPVKTRQSQN